LGGFAKIGSQSQKIGTNFGSFESREVTSSSIMSTIGHCKNIRRRKIFPASIIREEQEEILFDFGSDNFSESLIQISGNDFGSKILGCTGENKSSKSKSASATSATATSSSATSASGTSSSSQTRCAVKRGLGFGSNRDDDEDDGKGNGKKRKPETFDGEETLTAEELEEEEEEEEDGGVDASVLPSSQQRKTSADVVPSSDLEEAADEMSDGGEDADGSIEAEGGNGPGGDGDLETHEEPGGREEVVAAAGPSSQGNFQWRSTKVINQDTFPLKSKAVYKEAYRQFQTFLKGNGQFFAGVAPTEEALLNYFSYLRIDRHFAASSIWCTSAKLNACLKREFGFKLQDYPSISELLKSFDSGEVVKKAKVFTPQEVYIDSLLEY